MVATSYSVFPNRWAKGEKLLEALAQRLGKTLYEVATTPDSDLFPYT